MCKLARPRRLSTVPKRPLVCTEVSRRVLCVPIGVIMSSDLDLPVMRPAADILNHFKIPYELTIVVEYSRSAVTRGLNSYPTDPGPIMGISARGPPPRLCLLPRTASSQWCITPIDQSYNRLLTLDTACIRRTWPALPQWYVEAVQACAARSCISTSPRATGLPVFASSSQ
ncbi:hypothetical protein C8Q74DRAFT_322434 [Fomes fomentarius]|nr:hypothetical protein C8Q74DRAFT_322434 [Fomes fomentarius]